MEFWEGAILVVGGVWLVGHMSRNSAANKMPQSISAVGTVSSAGNTIATNTAGTPNLVAGEPLSAGAPPLPVRKIVGVNAPGSPIRNPPIAVANPIRSVIGKVSQPVRGTGKVLTL